LLTEIRAALVRATQARFFIDRDAGRPEADLAMDNMRHELATLCVLIEERVR
jgi:hypothetical protein